MALDDLRGEDALGLDIGQDLFGRVRRRRIGRDHHQQRLGVVDHRTERLSELMSNRGRQGGHRLAATGVGGECEVSPAVDLSSPPCHAARIAARKSRTPEWPMRPQLSEQCPGIRSTGSDLDRAHRCRAATDSRGCPSAGARASRTSAEPGSCGGTAMLRGGAPFKIRTAASAVWRARSSMSDQGTADNPRTEIRLCAANRGAFAER